MFARRFLLLRRELFIIIVGVSGYFGLGVLNSPLILPIGLVFLRELPLERLIMLALAAGYACQIILGGRNAP